MVNIDSQRGSHMRGLTGLLCTTALLAPLALAPKANAQIAISIGGPPPISSYGYYGYAPYSCAPVGYYGSGYFYNGIFLGMGPWSGWGYNHGWGGHRFVAAGGGRYNGGFAGYRGAHNSQPHAAPAHYNQSHAAAHNNQPHNAPHAAAAHAGEPHGGGGESHGGGGEHH